MLPAEASGTRLSLAKHADATAVRPGENITFRLRVRNTGEAKALDLRVCDRLPPGLAAVRAAGFLRTSDGRLCRSLGGLGIGRARVMTVTARVTPSAPLRVVNTATARADNAPTVSARAAVGHFVACPAVARRPAVRVAC